VWEICERLDSSSFCLLLIAAGGKPAED